MKMRLQNKAILIAGAGAGMGRALALLCAREGAHVTIVARRSNVSAETAAFARAQGYALETISADLDDAAQAAMAVARVRERFGRLDALCAAAGGGFRRLQSFLEIEPEFYTSVLRNHLHSVFNITRAAVPALLERGGGAIVIISAAYKTRRDGNIAYGTAKEGVVGFTLNLARELYPHNIRVNSIAPGLIRLPLRDGELRTPQATLQRRGMPEDVAYAALYLLSDESRWVTGQVLAVDGGDQVFAGKPYEAD